jgi:hypothetical protein
MDAIETRMRGSAEQSRGGAFNSGLADQGDGLRLQFVGSIAIVWLYALKGSSESRQQTWYRWNVLI